MLQLTKLEEKATSAKLELLFKRARFQLALGLARTHGLDDASVANIHKQYGDHLYKKGDFDGAMQQFIRTLGHLQPSYVIRKVRVHLLYPLFRSQPVPVPRCTKDTQSYYLPARSARARAR